MDFSTWTSYFKRTAENHENCRIEHFYLDNRWRFFLFPLIHSSKSHLKKRSFQLTALLPFSVCSSQPYVLLHGAIASRPCMHLKQMHLWCGLVRIVPCAQTPSRSAWVYVYAPESLCLQALWVWAKMEQCGCMSWHTRSDRKLTRICVWSLVSLFRQQT